MKPLPALRARLLRTFGDFVAPGGSRGALLILIYHRVLAEPDPLLPGEPDASAFAAQMDVVGAVCNVLPLLEAAERLQRGALPPRAACITFDDGYANNYSVAAPILRARKLPATVFVATGYTDNARRMFNDTVIESIRRAPSTLDLSALGLPRLELHDDSARARAVATLLGALRYLDPSQRLTRAEEIAAHVGAALPDDLMMSERQIRGLDSFGIAVGAHTVTHPILKNVEAAVAEREIAASKATLEAITAAPVPLFAYPNGRPQQDYDSSHVALVRKAGFKAAVSTAFGAAGRSADLLQLPRMLPWESTAFMYSLRLLRTYRDCIPATA
jgi:peptidoglycan/xylan/chitin deacetylase (PgdA/CDA1 family)